MHKRLNITLPEETIRLIDRTAEKGNRSRFIDAAVRRYVREAGRAHIRNALAEGYRRGADQDQQLAEEWFTLDEEAFQSRT